MNQPVASSDSPSGPRRSYGGLARVARLARKELRETLRDRRTIGTLILMPLILYPILSIAFQRFLLSHLQLTAEVYRIGVESDEGLTIIRDLVRRGHDLLDERQAPEDEGPWRDDRPPSFDAPDRPPRTVKPTPDIQWSVHSQLAARVARMQLDLGILVEPPTADPGEPRGRDPTVRLLYRENSVVGQAAALFMTERLRAVTDEMLRHWPAREAPPLIRIVHSAVESEDTAGFSLAALVPLILVLTTITGAVYPAIDLTAGERERGTLETLIAAPVPRLALLFAKYIAVLTVAMLTASVNLIAMTITLEAAGLATLLFGTEGLRLSTVAIVFLLLVLFAGFFSAVLLALTSFARSFKEAQAYLIPLMLVALAPGLLSLMPGVELTGPLTIVPLVNMVLLARDVFEGTAQLLPAAAAVLSTLFYAFAAIAFAARIFGTDAVLYGTQQSWSDWWQRPDTPRSIPPLAQTMTCLALLFPAYIVVAGTLGQWQTAGPAVQLIASGLATLLLFGGIPLLLMWRARIGVGSGFGLNRAPLASFLAAAVLGLTCWVLAHEVIMLRTYWGAESAISLQRERIEMLLESWRAVPAWLIVLALAAAPAVGEELFFRGYLLGSLRAVWRPSVAITVSAVVFGSFHLLTMPMLASERFVTSMLMGLVLGWVYHRTGSVLPGMVLHVVNNTLLLLAAYYREVLKMQGWHWLDEPHLPPAWIAAATVVVVAAIAAIAWATRRPVAHASRVRPTV